MAGGRAKRSKAEADAQRTKEETDGIEEVLTPGYVENMCSYSFAKRRRSVLREPHLERKQSFQCRVSNSGCVHKLVLFLTKASTHHLVKIAGFAESCPNAP